MHLTEVIHTRDVAQKLAVAHRGEGGIPTENEHETAHVIVQAGLTLVYPSHEPAERLGPSVAFETGWQLQQAVGV
ncbi:hypothetical protein NSZ01_20880 [Nocardioides szechwanensis]|uniref:Uncharacterized protein n=1 Tax=Nocardioides szechwanensis TaxID=1005944 RepID=A0A1H0HXR5_9ACTN|nr:hypothetical protein [Nocardioides szechwanensis]GEP34320.1 hypothetical protein NSZ01_20880 [Nocardioides szechwanensis]SDO23939.1 hypothetical protein SAMN05192576_3609 [Nocardioides szechwanensis]